jgi:predicted RNA binding protein YcfA (HicA-like mRNA interferase family)
MSRYAALKSTIITGRFYSNIDFHLLCKFLIHLGFSVRVKGDHHIFFKDGVAEIINLQPRAGKAKPYQVKQVRAILLRYRLGDENAN